MMYASNGHIIDSPSLPISNQDLCTYLESRFGDSNWDKYIAAGFPRHYIPTQNTIPPEDFVHIQETLLGLQGMPENDLYLKIPNHLLTYAATNAKEADDFLLRVEGLRECLKDNRETDKQVIDELVKIPWFKHPQRASLRGPLRPRR
ncbi:MAG: hypothetical protein ACMXYC_04115 [Candidatus Woesearchaeota archaeon]